MNELVQIVPGVVFSSDVLGVDWVRKYRSGDRDMQFANRQSLAGTENSRSSHERTGSVVVAVANREWHTPCACRPLRYTDIPPESGPDACTRFVCECVPGLTKGRLLARGWTPTWRLLTQLIREGLKCAIRRHRFTFLKAVSLARRNPWRR